MEIQVVTIKLDDLVKIVDAAVAKQFEKINNQDRLLNIAQICQETELTRHTFDCLKKKHNLKCVGGKYSLLAVKKAMQS